MVDIIIVSKAILQMHIVVDGRKDIFLGDVLRNQVMDITFDCLTSVLKCVIFFQNFFEYRVVY